MKVFPLITIIVSFSILIFSCKKDNKIKNDDHDWAIIPFEKVDSLNPVLLPDPQSTFLCPVRNDSLKWEAKDVFNPSAVVRNGQVWMLYRAEDTLGKFNGTSRLGLAVSDDGLHFLKKPVIILSARRSAISTRIR